MNEVAELLNESSARQRILALRLLEKQKKYPELAKELGIDVKIKENNKLNNNEKDEKKKSQNESIAILLTEAAELLNKEKTDPMEVFKLLKEVDAPLGIKLTSENIKNIMKPCPIRDLTSCVVIAYYDDVNLGKDKTVMREINKYVAQLNKIAIKYKYYVTRTIDKYDDLHSIQIWFNNNKKDRMR